jgi:hypothetical protein
VVLSPAGGRATVTGGDGDEYDESLEEQDKIERIMERLPTVSRDAIRETLRFFNGAFQLAYDQLLAQHRPTPKPRTRTLGATSGG